VTAGEHRQYIRSEPRQGCSFDRGLSIPSVVEFCETVADVDNRLTTKAESLGHHRQIVTQGQFAFPKLVSNFTAFKPCEPWIGDPAPSHRLPLLQLINFLI
jgi:hypothetical protein